MSTAFHEARNRMFGKQGDKLLTLLAALIALLMFVGAPLAAMGGVGFHIMGALTIVAMMAVSLLLYGRLQILIPLGIAFSMSATSIVLRHTSPSIVDIYLSAFAWLLLTIVWAWIVGRSVFAPGCVTYHRVIGAVFLYLLVAMLFASLYMLIGAGNPKAFTGLVVEDSIENASHLIYFSLSTLTTAGYGDIVPASPFARSLANLESAFGALYPATLIARLVSLEIAGNSSSSS